MILEVRGQPRLALPDDALRIMAAIHGDAFLPWLADLPRMLENIVHDLEAKILPCLPALSYHIVVFGRSERLGDIVIKCTPPYEGFLQESIATTHLAESGGCRVWMIDTALACIVSERLLPGIPVDGDTPTLTSDAAITERVAALARNIAERGAPASLTDRLPDMRRWTRALDTVDSATDLWAEHEPDIVRARNLRNLHLARGAQPVLLHGDLHHANVLRDERRGWVPIDPKGVVGPAAFEFGAFALNPWAIVDHADLVELEQQRVEIWSRVTGIPPGDLIDWAYIAAVLSACWTVEDGTGDWAGALRIAGVFRTLGTDPGT